MKEIKTAWETTAQRIADLLKPKCSRCGNDQIEEHHNFCVVCGKQLKKSPVINYSCLEFKGKEVISFPLPDGDKNIIIKLAEKYLNKDLAETIKKALLSDRGNYDPEFVIAVLNFFLNL